MHELLVAVADAVERVGGRARTHIGRIDDVAGEDTVTVVVPHEYFALDAYGATQLWPRTIGFGVEHPGTATFETSARLMPHLGAAFEISEDSVAELRRRGVRAERFTLGCSPLWRSTTPVPCRDVDVLHLGTADESRLRKLAMFASESIDLRTEFMLPPHEPMTRNRPDFVMGSRKRELLARSRLVLNLHREGNRAFEWVRALEAIANGCVVLTEPSTGLSPLVPGEHVLVAPAERLGVLARAALTDPEWLDDVARAAFDVCAAELDMPASARLLVDVATGLAPARPAVAGLSLHAGLKTHRARHDEPLAEWVPSECPLPDPAAGIDPVRARLAREVAILRDDHAAFNVVTRTRAPNADVDVVCVRTSGDGPFSVTMRSLESTVVLAAAQIADLTRPHVAAPFEAVAVAAGCTQPVSRGRARNELLARGTAEFVLVLDAGDELLGDALDRLVAVLRDDPELIAALPMALSGTGLIVNALVPEERRLAKFAYLSRGYVVRRRWLESLGGFGEEPELEGFVDHDFWRRTSAAGGVTRLIRSVGLRLWRQQPPVSLRDVDGPAVLACLDRRAAAAVT